MSIDSSWLPATYWSWAETVPSSEGYLDPAQEDKLRALGYLR